MIAGEGVEAPSLFFLKRFSPPGRNGARGAGQLLTVFRKDSGIFVPSIDV